MSGSLNPSSLARLLGEWNLGAAPAYRELADVVRLLVLDGRVPLDVALPSERALAATLGISRTTVTAAYSLLREQGFLSSGQGSRGRTCIPQAGPRGGSKSGANLSGAPGLAVPDGILDLAYASLPASGEVVHRAFASALTELPALLPGFGYDALGVNPLREAIAGHYSAAGVPTTARQILVTSGAQHALNIVLRTLAGRSDKVLVEHPSYPNAHRRHPGRGLPAGAGGHARRPPGRPVRGAFRRPSGLGPGGDRDRADAAAARHGLRGPGLPQSHRAADVRFPAAPAGPRRRRSRHRPRRRRDAPGVEPRRRRLHAAGRLQPRRRLHRLPQQVALGRAADRLDPGRRIPDPALRRRPHHHGPRRPGGGTARGGPPGQRTRRTAPGAAGLPAGQPGRAAGPHRRTLAGLAERTARRRPVRVVPPSGPDQHRTGRGGPGLRHPARGRAPLRHGRRLRALSPGAVHPAPGAARNRGGGAACRPGQAGGVPAAAAQPRSPARARPSPEPDGRR